MDMRILKALFAVVLSASFLVACGGGDGGTDTSTSGGGNGSSNLKAAYDAINASSTPGSVATLVGRKHARITNGVYIWESDIGTADPKILGITLYSSGTVFIKSYQSVKTDYISQRY